ncbi:helix-turn-helix transcriptional regulator [Pseudomonas aeruginosa]|jgi:DNA-binding XRE family transcriptional regulator|uniref:helix-turn-helix transcriptional regulator n=1 Tax=Pseudomonas aeruginosa TaxID=287 RepID=UPI00053DFB01|nr:helix-turn-helix transcriptional regulator [Pseudomonas aeruginosa]EIU1420960.1 helix-turn-helix transcriptional regulator [Pseudomonas aeruginosa]EKU3796349.1 helix-turn-helix transcriptional regulator [Pseudomonas aeruginosa]EKX0260034.1 helix-turn-helix transcriptional regulator [Pseudomonas aeruginosa]EKX6389211.1 helix-turn-helix transcriptional regulator [Pseudomonas aeruginosa]KSL04018.2 transcriptional regulator [Pseudomonas aeruginosa]
MTTNIIDLDEERLRQARDILAKLQFSDDIPLQFMADHCEPARALLGWSVEALAFRSGVSPKAIAAMEAGKRKLRRVTMQALAFTFEKEMLIFLPGHPPMIGSNCSGATPDPRERADYHLLE